MRMRTMTMTVYNNDGGGTVWRENYTTTNHVDALKGETN
jgi:hypothetical protein